jgi:hypothetical protein
MDVGHVTQLAKDQLGRSKVVYRQDLTRPPGQAHLKVDDLGAGDIVFVDTGIANSNPAHNFTADGLLLSVDRPLGAAVNIGHWAAAEMQGVALPEAFLLVATFERPSQVGLGTAPAAGTYAPSLLINTGTLMGATSQFRPEGVRLNLPGTGVMPNRPPISQSFVDRILDPQHPSPFTLALMVSRTAATGVGKAFLFVGNDEADSFAFNFANLSTATPIVDIRAGIGTASGSEYRVSVFLLDFQIWAPTRQV